MPDGEHAPALALLDRVEAAGRAASGVLEPGRRKAMGQFMTPAPVARFMASLFRTPRRSIRLLDAGAGVGSLTAAFVEAVCARGRRPSSLVVTAYEVDPILLPRLRRTLEDCCVACDGAGIDFHGEVRAEDFVEAASTAIDGGLFATAPPPSFDCAILNPPYRKVHAASKERAALRRIGVETSNLYSAFLALAIKLLADKGELVAITPRSFTNGPYFQPFRRLLLERTSLRRVHVFERRDEAFAVDEVLQENLILHVVCGAPRTRILLTSSAGPGQPITTSRRVEACRVVLPDDPALVIRFAQDQEDEDVARRISALPCTLGELGLDVSTGRVVDFRAREYLRRDAGTDTAPLIYPAHFEAGFVAWPRPGGRKPNALLDDHGTAELLIPNATHVLVKRFSSKEERRRIVAAVYDPVRVAAARVGFENHLNYFHARGAGLTLGLAKGLAAFLNTTAIDRFFRQFSGHTQVNAADLRSLRYPGLEELEALGARIGDRMPDQKEVDRLAGEEVFAR